MAKQRCFLFIILICLVILPRYSQAMDVEVRKDHISGRIYYLSDNSGISNLVVKLTPSRELMDRISRTEIEKLIDRTSITDQNGQFNFTGLPKWHYLLEVYNGPNLLYRDIMDMNKEKHKNVILLDTKKVYESNIKVKIIPDEYRWE
jgi:hypothetical protein